MVHSAGLVSSVREPGGAYAAHRSAPRHVMMMLMLCWMICSDVALGDKGVSGGGGGGGFVVVVIVLLLIVLVLLY